MPTNATATVHCDIKDLSLAVQGKRRIEWAFQSMPVLQAIRKQFIKDQPLAGIRVAACLQITPETANLLVTLRDGGAAIALATSDPVLTQDDVAASLVRDYLMPVYAVQGEDQDLHTQHITEILDHEPQIAIEAGAHLASVFHTSRQQQAASLAGGIEESATGVNRLRAIARQCELSYPVIGANESATKRLFENRHGTGQSTVDAIVRATNMLFAGLTVVVAGYGWCGRGIAARARGLGANVIVTEVDPMKAVEAVMDGFRVMTMNEAAACGMIFITVTGNRAVISRDHFEKLKDGAILCNAGQLNGEIDVETLGKMVNSRRDVRASVEELKLKDGRRVYLLGGGRLINLAAADGNPASVLDMSYATLALSAEFLVKSQGSLPRQVHPLPDAIDRHVARLKLGAMGVAIDKLTFEQEEYLASRSEGNQNN